MLRLLFVLMAATLFAGSQAHAQVRFDVDICQVRSVESLDGRTNGNDHRVSDPAVSRILEIRYGIGQTENPVVELYFFDRGGEGPYCFHRLTFLDETQPVLIHSVDSWRDFFPEYDSLRRTALEPCIETSINQRIPRFGHALFRDELGRPLLLEGSPSCPAYVDGQSAVFLVETGDTYYLVLIVVDELFVLRTNSRPR